MERPEEDVAHGLRWQLGFWWWRLRCVVRYYTRADPWAWWLARHLPERIAFHCFIRVYAVLGDVGPDFERVCQAWEWRYRSSGGSSVREHRRAPPPATEGVTPSQVYEGDDGRQLDGTELESRGK